MFLSLKCLVKNSYTTVDCNLFNAKLVSSPGFIYLIVCICDAIPMSRDSAQSMHRPINVQTWRALLIRLLWGRWSRLKDLTGERNFQYLTGDNLRVAWAEFSTLSWAELLCYKGKCIAYTWPLLDWKLSPGIVLSVLF